MSNEIVGLVPVFYNSTYQSICIYIMRVYNVKSTYLNYLNNVFLFISNRTQLIK